MLVALLVICGEDIMTMTPEQATERTTAIAHMLTEAWENDSDIEYEVQQNGSVILRTSGKNARPTKRFNSSPVAAFRS